MVSCAYTNIKLKALTIFSRSKQETWTVWTQISWCWNLEH